MQKLGLSWPGFLASKPQRNKTNILDLNYDCLVEIFSYLTALEDKLNLARAHSQFCEVFAHAASRRYAKINMRMLRSISDWDYLLKLCGEGVVECELRHGRWDAEITQPFLTLLNAHCQNLRVLYLIFAHSDLRHGAEDADLNILEMLEHKKLRSLSLIDANAGEVLQLQHFVELEDLHIDGIDDALTDADFVQLFQSLSALRRLSLRFASRRALPPLCAHCPWLEHLTLENFEGTLDDVGDFPKLISLRLLWRLNVGLNSNLFRMLAKRYDDRLEQLQLTKVNLEQVHHIVALKSLKALSCHMWPTEALLHLGQLKQLECVDLRCTAPTASMMQLLHMIKSCIQLQHLKLSKDWQQQELEGFLCVVHEELRSQAAEGCRKKLVITLEFEASKEAQNELQQKLSPQLLRLDWRGVACPLCMPDGHTKQSIPGLNYF